MFNTWGQPSRRINSAQQREIRERRQGGKGGNECRERGQRTRRVGVTKVDARRSIMEAAERRRRKSLCGLLR